MKIFTTLLITLIVSFSFAEAGKSSCEDLVLHLPLDGGCYKDASGQGQATSNSEAIPGKDDFVDCYWFDGIDDYIRVKDFTYGPLFTVSFWFNSEDNAGTLYQYMFSHGQVHRRNTANYYFCEDDHELNPGQIKSNHLDEDDEEASELLFTDSGLSDGKWHFYTITAGKDGTRVYLDGKFWRAAPELGGDPINPKGDIIIGSRNDLKEDRSYEGYLDDIRVYNRVLSAEEIKKLHEQGR